MESKQAMDLFGEALKAYSLGERDKFYFKNEAGEMFEHNLKRYFRKTREMSKMEMSLINLSYGKILDVGCGTGNYIPLLNKRGKVLGIDISSKVIAVAVANGCKNCVVGDIFSISTRNKYDTITLFENNLGLGGSVRKTKELLNKLSCLLKENGQILAMTMRLPDKDYLDVELKPVWKGKVGGKFGWIHFNINFLSGLCKEGGLNLQVLKGNRYCYLVRIKKS